MGIFLCLLENGMEFSFSYLIPFLFFVSDPGDRESLVRFHFAKEAGIEKGKAFSQSGIRTDGILDA